ncbi:2-amino-4-hydroxy-6-hydroxymethyldihydropteridine diphosphokinase [Litoreibacter roseus]|uniref:2-amino-4-hydroxy-6-hydroxymethyldihydropteridine pyrophosphokinase n=1 Tax=Litoreibacter roseus TaxID=2601869 RepID=A0A6N6JM93_9RHOB|nr:2-amino-4-hydroxy-6-hydroxymethyldihydropteridine diphosphokinase [Litoreibacter roseus]GFE66398.1 2-amino-4-hydroxy-6-hydroxymethyldihydropteridine pyrophosphokinase [Litoreibacter roseus]
MPQPCPRLEQYTSVYIALGANATSSLRSSFVTLSQSLDALDSASVSITSTSCFYVTPAFPAGSGPDFVNAVVNVATRLKPAELLPNLHSIEAEFGRVRAERWGARTLDLDLLAFEDIVLPDLRTAQAWAGLPLDDQIEKTPDQLVLPHPRMAERAFVLVPFCDIARTWRHPITGKTAQAMLDALPQQSKDAIKPYTFGF